MFRGSKQQANNYLFFKIFFSRRWRDWKAITEWRTVIWFSRWTRIWIRIRKPPSSIRFVFKITAHTNFNELSLSGLFFTNLGRKLFTHHYFLSTAFSGKTFWSYEATIALINSVESHKEELHHAVKRKRVWDHVSNDLLSQHIEVSWWLISEYFIFSRGATNIYRILPLVKYKYSSE